MSYSIRVLEKIIVLFIAMIAGFIVKKAKICDAKSTKTLSGILATITNPCLMVASLQIERTPERLKLTGWILLLSLIIHVVVAIIATFMFKPIKEEKARPVFSFGMTYTNCGFMGFPVMMAIFGAEDGLFYGVIYNVIFNLFAWSHGVIMMSGGFDRKTFIKKLFNPVLMSVFVGFFLFICNIKLPTVLFDGIDMLGDVTFPLSMIIIGSLLADIKFKEIFKDIRLYIFSAIKLFVIPFAVLLICMAIGLDNTLTIIAVTMTAAPAATNTAVVAELYGADSSVAAKIVGFSTLFCLASMPLMLMLTEKMGFVLTTV